MRVDSVWQRRWTLGKSLLSNHDYIQVVCMLRDTNANHPPKTTIPKELRPGSTQVAFMPRNTNTNTVLRGRYTLPSTSRLCACLSVILSLLSFMMKLSQATIHKQGLHFTGCFFASQHGIWKLPRRSYSALQRSPMNRIICERMVFAIVPYSSLCESTSGLSFGVIDIGDGCPAEYK